GIIVRFVGICTHFPNFDAAGTWRVVLINASDPGDIASRYPSFPPMMPHFAQLRLVGEQISAIQGDLMAFSRDGNDMLRNLGGVELKILNGADASLVDQTACGLPKLSTWRRGGVHAGSAASSSTSRFTACRFDFKTGTLAGTSTPGKACVVRLTARTSGDPKLVSTPLGGG